MASFGVEGECLLVQADGLVDETGVASAETEHAQRASLSSSIAGIAGNVQRLLREL